VQSLPVIPRETDISDFAGPDPDITVQPKVSNADSNQTITERDLSLSEVDGSLKPRVPREVGITSHLCLKGTL